jgi:hypothetical protein
MDAVDDDRASRRQLPGTSLNFVGIAPDRADDHSGIGGKGPTAADIDENGRGGRADHTVQIQGGNRRGLLSIHVCALLA